jgi:hypothetical protein
MDGEHNFGDFHSEFELLRGDNTPPPKEPRPKKRKVSDDSPLFPETSARPFAYLYVRVVLPVVGACLVAIEARVVFGMYQLLAFVAAALFGWWVFDRKLDTSVVRTWDIAFDITRRATILFGSVPALSGLVFLVGNSLFGVFWGYAGALVVAYVGVVRAEGILSSPKSTSGTVERGQKEGGIDAKLRAEYKKAMRQHKGR